MAQAALPVGAVGPDDGPAQGLRRLRQCRRPGIAEQWRAARRRAGVAADGDVHRRASASTR